MGDDDDPAIHWPEIYPERRAVWPHAGVGSEAYEAVNNKILSVFDNVKSLPLKRIIIQFWRPTKTPDGKKLLSCFHNPYALSLFNRRLAKYRSYCSKCYYTISDQGIVLDDYPIMTITSAPPSTAARSHFPKVVLDLSAAYRGIPFVDIALECDLTCFMMLPAFSQTSCVGVVEVSGVLAVLSASVKCTFFVICLRSCHTGELDYAFEFFWPQSRNHLALMEALILTLKEYLPSFKYASGVQLGDALLVVDVENSSSGCGSKPIMIFPKNELSETPKALEESRALMGQSELNETNQYPYTNINNPEGEDAKDTMMI
ncbi:hypothetical protein M8C21_034020 [Ambrosia artemisiifolia]|uniref:NLP1-9 GAF domain-containing protein n=1 Tax=Ambrosia artemisiifolia TaxID=4212 RepID=A0AAD5CUS6_AMBAR|nr:hypothetical protein M8C21_034020 [Ambrosia artemisiifolia]